MKGHGDRLESLFVEVVRLAQKMEIVSLGQVAIDGSTTAVLLPRVSKKANGMITPWLDEAIHILAAEREPKA